MKAHCEVNPLELVPNERRNYRMEGTGFECTRLLILLLCWDWILLLSECDLQKASTEKKTNIPRVSIQLLSNVVCTQMGFAI